MKGRSLYCLFILLSVGLIGLGQTRAPNHPTPEVKQNFLAQLEALQQVELGKLQKGTLLSNTVPTPAFAEVTADLRANLGKPPVSTYAVVQDYLNYSTRRDVTLILHRDPGLLYSPLVTVLVIR